VIEYIIGGAAMLAKEGACFACARISLILRFSWTLAGLRVARYGRIMTRVHRAWIVVSGFALVGCMSSRENAPATLDTLGAVSHMAGCYRLRTAGRS
jgi:hypothetical protein